MKIKYLIAFFALAAALAGCKEAAEYTPSIYLTEAQVDDSKTITIAAPGEIATFSVSTSVSVGQETKITLSTNPELVAQFNEKYGKTCKMFDENGYEFRKKEVKIKSGANMSDDAEVVINQEIAPGTFYCLPVTIASTTSDMAILEPSRTLFLVFRSPVKNTAVFIGSQNKYIVPTFHTKQGLPGERDLSKIAELTLECRVNVTNFVKSDPYITSVMGVEGDCCMRFGDVKIGPDVLQVCKGDYQPSVIKNPAATNKWYHLAAVWSRSALTIYIDGKFMTETKHQGETVDLSHIDVWAGQNTIGFALGAGSNYNGNRPLNGYLAEARVWTRALGGKEIANIKDLVIVDPQSPDLLAYWKMDKSETTTDKFPDFRGWPVKNKNIDITGHGYDAYGLSTAPAFIDAVW